MRLESYMHSAFVLAAMAPAGQAVDISWYPPRETNINNLTAALDGEGVYGFIFNTSETPDERYGTYNWCNMPHVRRTEYVRAPDEYELQYLEIVSSPVYIHEPLIPCFVKKCKKTWY